MYSWWYQPKNKVKDVQFGLLISEIALACFWYKWLDIVDWWTILNPAVALRCFKPPSTLQCCYHQYCHGVENGSTHK